jgi:hypothetical protein
MWLACANNLVWGAILLGVSYALRGHGAIGLAIAFFMAYALKTPIFLPIYFAKGLVPKGSILSLEAGVIWLALATVCTVTLLGAPIGWRVFTVLLGSFLMAGAFYRIAKRPMETYTVLNP